MKHQTTLLLVACLVYTLFSNAQDDEYITFNDRRNVVHGIYFGLNFGFGEIDGKDTGTAELKFAYVANQQLEVGVSVNGIYSRQNVFNTVNNRNENLVAGYAGLHLEPILFSKSRINLSFPLFIGAGAVGYVDSHLNNNNQEIELEEDDTDAIFVVEPGVNALLNISRFVQLEAGVKYRFSSRIELVGSPVDRINGFSAGVGIKLGIFNMGRNRYKKKLK